MKLNLLTEAEGIAVRHSHRMWGPILVNEADLQCGRGKTNNANALLDEAKQKIEAWFPDQPWQMAILESVLGQCLSLAGNRRDAERLLLSSLPVVEERWGRHALFTDDARSRIAAHYARVGDKLAAKRYRRI